MIPYVNLKVMRETRKRLRQIAHKTKRKHYEIVHEAVENEWKRVNQESK